MALNYDPVEKGYVASLARPGRNITGVFFRNLEVGAKQRELLHEAIPGAARAGILWTTFSADQIPPIEAAACNGGVLREQVERRRGNAHEPLQRGSASARTPGCRAGESAGQGDLNMSQ